MKKYLDKDISDYNINEIKSAIGDVDKEYILKIFKELRLYKNNEFSFIEVFNKDSFDENAEIVKEVIKLLENWKIRY